MDNDRVLWAATRDDYEKANKIARAIWPEADDAVIQACTATLLIHHKDLSRENRLHVKVPPASGSGVVAATQSAGGDIPPCPTCGGETYDNREKKASGQFKPTSPDFTCKDKQCKNDKGFRSGVWVKQENTRGPRAQGNAQPVAAGGYDQKPGPLINDEPDDLPF